MDWDIVELGREMEGKDEALNYFFQFEEKRSAVHDI